MIAKKIQMENWKWNNHLSKWVEL